VVDFAGASAFAVPRGTGTPGDDLVAWGLAIFLADLAVGDVSLRASGDRFILEVEMGIGDLLEAAERVGPGEGARLPWLASPEKGRLPPEDIGEWRDRDAMREGWKGLIQARKTGADRPAEGDAPGVVAGVRGMTRYPLFRALTSPGTQWTGYNGFAEIVQRRVLSPAGRSLVLQRYRADEPLTDAEVDTELKALGLKGSAERWRNPPGFLYPGLNKGPTMRLRTETGSVGTASEPDWTLADRGDRDVLQLYLAYTGYFAVGQILETEDERVVIVPAPADVRVPQALTVLGEAAPAYSAQRDYLLARTSLAYAGAALRYWADLATGGGERYPQLLAGVHLGIFWKPNANTYAPSRQAMAPLPAWLVPLLTDVGFGATREMLALHERRVANLRGARQEETRLGAECRTALTLYVAALGGDARKWLEAVAAWYPAARAVEGARVISLWTTEEVRRMLMATATSSDLEKIVASDAFNHIAGAIRSATVFAHYARMARKRGGADTPAFETDYDLVTELSAAAGRRPEEFLRGLFEFVARYNDETMRRNETARARAQRTRALVVKEDLEQITAWVLADRTGLIPAALLAFGTSRLPRRDAVQAAASEGLPPEVVTADDLSEVEDAPAV